MKKRYLPYIIALIAILTIATILIADDSPWITPEPPEFTFIVMGDSRPGLPAEAQPRMFKDLIMRADAYNPGFVVHTGDAIYGSSSLGKVQEQYKDFKDAVKPLRAKLYLTIGNHEVQNREANQTFFEKEIGGLYYSFDLKGSHFIVLDSHIVGEAGRIAGKQLDWLKEDLRKSRTARHRFVFIHMPLYPVDGHMGACLDAHPEERDALHKLFMLNRVDTVFVGHEHFFDEQKRNGVRYVISGGAGAPVFPSLKGKGDFYHFVIVNVNGDSVKMKGFRPAQRGRPEEEFRIPPDQPRVRMPSRWKNYAGDGLLKRANSA